MRNTAVSFVAFGRGSSRRMKAERRSQSRYKMNSHLLLRQSRQDWFHSAIGGHQNACSTSLLLPDDLDQHPLGPVAVELAVEDLLPRPEVQLTLGNGDDDFAAHDLPLQVGI